MHALKDLMWWVEEEIFWVGMEKWTRPKFFFFELPAIDCSVGSWDSPGLRGTTTGLKCASYVPKAHIPCGPRKGKRPRKPTTRQRVAKSLFGSCIRLNQAGRMQGPAVWLPGSARARGTPRPGSAGTSKLVVPVGPGWLDALLSRLMTLLVYN
jgi:hypothetical protein